MDFTYNITLTEDEFYQVQGLLNDAIFANRKRLQHAQNKIDLNVPGNDPRNTINEMSEELCRDQLGVALQWYTKFSEIDDNVRGL